MFCQNNPRQAVQTQIRLLLQEHSVKCLQCLQIVILLEIVKHATSFLFSALKINLAEIRENNYINSLSSNLDQLIMTLVCFPLKLLCNVYKHDHCKVSSTVFGFFKKLFPLKSHYTVYSILKLFHLYSTVNCSNTLETPSEEQCMYFNLTCIVF